MDDMLQKLNGSQTFVFLTIVLGAVSGTAISLAGIIVPQWKKIRQAEAESQLKRDLIAAGFTVDEIERVVQATATRSRKQERASCHG